MGAFLAGFHVRSTSTAALDGLLTELGDRTRRTDPEDGWISVYDERASMQDTERIAELTTLLSDGAGAPVVAFMVHDSDFVQCWASVPGVGRSHVDSWPGYPDDEPDPTVDTPEALLALCDGLDEAGLMALLARDVVFAEDIVAELAGFLGIPTARALSDYGDDGTESRTDALADVIGRLQAQLGSPGEATSPRAGELVAAADSGDLVAAAALLGEGVPPDAMAPWVPHAVAGMSGASLEIAATALFVAAFRDRPAVIGLLLERGADPDLRISQGSTPLAAAAGAGHLACVEALLDGGADPLARDAAGMTAADAVAATRQQLRALRASLDLLGPAANSIAVPDDAALAACAEALEQAAGS